MDFQIALLLGQDGIVNGAVYGLMALALVLVFSVTRVIFIPQGELVAFGALSMAALNAGRVPATLWLLVALAVATLAVEGWRWKRGATVEWMSTLVWTVAFPALAALMVLGVRSSSLSAQAVSALLIITPLGPLLYRLAYRPLANATVLTLLIVSVALHGVLVGLGLLFFGAEGSRTPAFSEARFDLGGLPITGQSLVVVGVALALVILMFLFYERSIVGKALRATAMNR
ncbi:MAG: branched-chain amino acid ABC transporter permease, partial [Variovorax sp.]